MPEVAQRLSYWEIAWSFPHSTDALICSGVMLVGVHSPNPMRISTVPVSVMR